MRSTSFQSFRFACIYMLTIPLAFMIPPLIATSNYQGWILILLGGAINVVLILCTYKLGKKASKSSWADFGEKVAGKWGHRIIQAVLLFWSVYYVSLDMEQFTLFYGFVYMRETPPWFLQLMVGIVIWIVARWGFASMVYIADGTFMIILIGIAFLLVVLSGDADYQMLPALFNHFDIGTISKDVISVISWIGEWFVFLYMLPEVTFDKKTLRNLLLSNALVIFAVLLTWLLVLLNFGPHYGSHLKYPVLQLIRGTSFTGIIGNADPVFIGLWVMSMVVHDAFLIYIGVTCMSKLFKIKETKPLLTLLMGTAIVAAYQYSRNTTTYQKDLAEQAFILFWVLIDGLPLYYLLLGLIRRSVKKKKTS